MVSKIVVAALVLIVACPILLGYAMNLTEINETGYKPEGESVNVTPLLKTSTYYNYASADPFQMNSETRFASSKALPVYEKVSGTKTSLPLTKWDLNWSSPGTQALSDLSIFSVHPFYDHISYSINFVVYNSSSQPLVSVVNFDTLYYSASEKTIYYTYYNSGSIISSYFVNSDMNFIVFSYTGAFVTTPTNYCFQNKVGNSSYVDISSGFHFVDNNYSDNVPNNIWLPSETRKAILTVDLDSITAPNYTFGVQSTIFVKTTTAGVVSWKATSNFSDDIDLYYDPYGDNVYQICLERNESNDHVDIRYVGSWPTIIGEANYYQSYGYDYSGGFFQNISIHSLSTSTSPKMRMDLAEFKAFEQPIIEDKSYEPASFKTNPLTTITDPQIIGESLTFGGISYTISNGNINLNGHNIPVKGLVLSSVPNENGGYDNKIGNTIVSTTANPSTIYFDGRWSVSITTQSQESYTITKTEWTPGQFGWDGLDQNFLMVGLLTSIGVFIALGLYVRRTRSSLWPLLVVCGGAVMLFFIML